MTDHASALYLFRVLVGAATLGSLVVLLLSWRDHCATMRAWRERSQRSSAPPQTGVRRGTKMRGGRYL